MGNVIQRQESGRRNYAGSKIQTRNDMMRRTARLAPARRGDAGTDKFNGSARVMTAAEYVADGQDVDFQVSSCREAHLLVCDPYNEGCFNPVAIHDVAIKHEKVLYQLEIHSGGILVKPDTLIYWK